MVTNNFDGILKKYIHEYVNDPEFIAEGLAIKVTDEMLECLEQKGFSQSWLAEKMGVSRSLISRILNAPPNMTLLTIAKIAVALGTTPEVCLNSEPWRLSTLGTINNVPNTKDDKTWQTPTNLMAGGSDFLHLIPSEKERIPNAAS